jgi:DHA3 family macrolide efflux protein-like MFS transporter
MIWVGQLIFLLGTGMTQLALLIWAWQQAGAATALSLLVSFAYGPYVLVSPLAGIILDHYDRRLVMFWADLSAGLMTLVLLLLFPTGELRL